MCCCQPQAGGCSRGAEAVRSAIWPTFDCGARVEGCNPSRPRRQGLRPAVHPALTSGEQGVRTQGPVSHVTVAQNTARGGQRKGFHGPQDRGGCFDFVYWLVCAKFDGRTK